MTQWKVIDEKGQAFLIEAQTVDADEFSARFYVGAELVRDISRVVFIERVIE
jgi:hypothetical protein